MSLQERLHFTLNYPGNSQLSKRRSATRRLAAILCLLGIFATSGFHAFATQCYGWLRMYEAYSSTLSSTQALELTFSGDELCGICTISQELIDDLDDNLARAVSDSKASIFLSLEPIGSITTLPCTDTHTDPPQRNYQEIKIGNEPPPPRAA